MKREQPREVHQSVTDAIIAAIEAEPGTFTLPWQQPGRRLALPTNAVTGASYQGINIILLLTAAASRGYSSGQFASYRQLQDKGLQVRAGEKGTLIVFYKSYVPKGFAPDPEQPDDDGTRRVAKCSHVFALEQTEAFQPPPTPEPDWSITHPSVLALLKATGADVRIGGDRAFYNRKDDYIGLPSPAFFKQDAESERVWHFSSTALHELSHHSGHPSRLNRTFGAKYGDALYSMEEVVAEFSAAMLCARLGLSNHPRADHAQYIKSFVELMKADNRALFVAASKASEAANYIMAFLDAGHAHAA